MNNLKFRVFDKDRKVFAKQITTFKFDRKGKINLVVYLDKANKTKEIIEQEKIYCNNFDILQFIGLKDKNGKEIYEGDIVTIDEQQTNRYVICYSNEFALYCLAKPEGLAKVCNVNDIEVFSASFIYPLIYDGDKLVVIGNIYENPELLDSK